jgi:phosphoglucosamine mutase
MARLFGTDGVRGLAGPELSADLVRRLGRAAVAVLGAHGDRRPTFVVGRDTRSSGEWLEAALVEGIRRSGGDVVLAGVEPTPAVAYMTVDLAASSGVVISASHNPAEYNGVKFFGSDGMKLSDDLEDEIEANLDVDADAAEPGDVRTADLATERYIAHVVDAASARLDGMTVVVDCANGAASALAPALYRRLGATVHAIHDAPDGANINEGCGALHPDVVAGEVVRRGADVGVTHDGDADRALFADATGAVIDGDQVLAAVAAALHEDQRLPGATVATTVMANLGFTQAMAQRGIRVLSTKVGDRYVLEAMEREGAVLGGEQSGHLIFREHTTTGDGLLTAVRFLSLAAARGVSVRELASVMRRFPQVLMNVPVRDRDGLDTAADVAAAVAAAEAALGDAGRVLVRPSGTEPLIRVMVEAPTERDARLHADAIAEAVRIALA